MGDNIALEAKNRRQSTGDGAAGTTGGRRLFSVLTVSGLEELYKLLTISETLRKVFDLCVEVINSVLIMCINIHYSKGFLFI